MSEDKKFYNDNIEDVKNELEIIRASVPGGVLEIKHDLLSVYLMNLILYYEMKEEDRKASPVEDTLIKTTILLEKMFSIEEKAENIIKDAIKKEENECKKQNEDFSGDEVSNRLITEEMLKNKTLIKRRRKDESTPMKKYKKKAKKLENLKDAPDTRNIDTNKVKSKKFQ